MSATIVAGRKVPVGIIIFALAMGGFSIGTAEFAAMSLLPYYSATFGVTEADASHAISAYALGVVVGAPLLAVFGARMSRRWLLVGLMAFYALANLMAALAPSYPLMIIARFFAGFPHGAYFGVAMLLAASLVPHEKRTFAVSLVMTGLTVATLLGVPFASFLGQTIGWRWGIALVAILATATATLILLLAPRDAGNPAANPLRELSALKNRKVLLALLNGAVGFGGYFATYTYAASTLVEVTKVPEHYIPFVFMAMGVGMTVGTLIIGRLADRGLIATGWVILIVSFALQLIYPSATAHIWMVIPVLILINAFSSFGTVMQTWLMNVAGDAQTFAAAMNHASFNMANALGPFFAAMALSAGWGLPSTGYVAAMLYAVGMALYAIMIWDLKRDQA
ncbi:MFS transporter, DHA1 family, arabinose polymer utilization protein [Ketogulonicigenium robustum]|uniref:MFS transporter, DHA1 family, arabinose polymer utilization protein n=1 Tax=Ketogulonicigenium robustum TaxID=92947 RepID=A0A1W6NWC7_9RHOB|nr:MFS transporter [Ketogulonicigenium robustum]ARO13536.1 MFS transporter, DHA1 family, arabinose polymer utilization protein [Ketogulonicigenium robustum]